MTTEGQAACSTSRFQEILHLRAEACSLVTTGSKRGKAAGGMQKLLQGDEQRLLTRGGRRLEHSKENKKR
jgi:hypothetical protein